MTTSSQHASILLLRSWIYRIITYSIVLTFYKELDNHSSSNIVVAEESPYFRLDIPIQLVVQRWLPVITPQDAYQLGLQTFRDDKFGLAIAPAAIMMVRGNETTGIGCEVFRLPRGTIEKIVDYNYNDITGVYTLFYKIMNPNWRTFPCIDHLGQVMFTPNNYITTNTADNTTITTTNGTILDWIVKWEPMWPRDLANRSIYRRLNMGIPMAVNHIVELNPYNNTTRLNNDF